MIASQSMRSRPAVVAVLLALMAVGGARAQGPDLVQVTFSRAFGPTLALPSGGLMIGAEIDVAVRTGRAIVATPDSTPLRGDFLRQLAAAVDAGVIDSAIHVAVAVVRASLDGLVQERSYLHMRLEEVDRTVEALSQQSSQMSDASRRIAMNRGLASAAPVMTVRVDPRLFESLDVVERRASSCTPCFTQRMMRLGAVDLERETRDAASVQARLMAQRNEILQRGVAFNHRATRAVELFAEALKTVDGSHAGAIRRGLR